MKKLETLGRCERAVIDERRVGYGAVARFAAYEATLRALVGRLLPDVRASIDVAAFVDGHADHTLGRGDRKAGLPPVADLLEQGLQALTKRGFADSDAAEQDALIGRLRRGEADDALGFAAKEFVDRLLVLACAGYLAHPDAWERIGFNGPAYPEGYAWISKGAAARRHDGFVGAARL
ncbi:MAG: gluconate 2-dehydrogenase subunit 3 family protein [Actinomycetota bacterium]|nr:gluconate 2-dehydrogenase subunit 3 family protein [Actinomycetota bacterium]